MKMSRSFLSVLSVCFTAAAVLADSPVRLTAINSMERILQHQAPFGGAVAEIEAARNEIESFQIVVAAAGANIKVNSVTLRELVGDGGGAIGGDNIKFYRQEYVRVGKSSPRAELPPGLYPDPLVPFEHPETGNAIEPYRREKDPESGRIVVKGHEVYALPFSVYNGQNQPIWVDVSVPKDAKAGVYRGVARVSADEGSAEIPVVLRVWDFTLPDGPTHGNHFGAVQGAAALYDLKPGSEEFKKIAANYYKEFAAHRLNPPLPGELRPKVNADGSLEIDPERHAALCEFIQKHNVTDFQIPRSSFARLPRPDGTDAYKTVSPENREKSLRYYRDYQKYAKDNGWLEGAYVYLLDEPNSREQYEQVNAQAELVREAAPELRILVVEQTYPHAPDWPDIDASVDIWCPLWGYIDRESIARKIANGDEVWSYTALVQPAPAYHPRYEALKDKNPPYWHIDRPLLVYRIPIWINRQYDITGILYWSTVTKVSDPWHNPAFRQRFNGGGFLFYPGVPCGIDGPVASMRLKNLRDGMEDYEYFALLEKKVGAEAVKRIVDKVAPNWWDYTRDTQTILAARRAIGNAIEKTE